MKKTAGPKTAWLRMRLTPETLRTIDTVAKRDGRTRSDAIRKMLEFAVKNYKKAGSLQELVKMRVDPERSLR